MTSKSFDNSPWRSPEKYHFCSYIKTVNKPKCDFRRPQLFTLLSRHVAAHHLRSDHAHLVRSVRYAAVPSERIRCSRRLQCARPSTRPHRPDQRCGRRALVERPAAPDGRPGGAEFGQRRGHSAGRCGRSGSEESSSGGASGARLYGFGGAGQCRFVVLQSRCVMFFIFYFS